MEEVRECRICLQGESEDNTLLQPCKCNTAYVHEECLQKWREENIDNEKYSQCEICKERYIIYRPYKVETFIIKINSQLTSPVFFCYYILQLFLLSLFISSFDLYFNQKSITLLNFGDNDNNFNKYFSNDEAFWSIYYVNYTSYITSMLFFLFIFIGIALKVHRKKIYWKKNKYLFLASFLITWNYFYLYYIFYKGRNNLESYPITCLVGIIINYCSINTYTKRHNKFIKDLNISNKETIISVEYNPLIEIPMIDQEEDVPLTLSNSSDF